VLTFSFAMTGQLGKSGACYVYKSLEEWGSRRVCELWWCG